MNAGFKTPPSSMGKQCHKPNAIVSLSHHPIDKKPKTPTPLETPWQRTLAVLTDACLLCILQWCNKLHHIFVLRQNRLLMNPCISQKGVQMHYLLLRSPKCARLSTTAFISVPFVQVTVAFNERFVCDRLETETSNKRIMVRYGKWGAKGQLSTISKFGFHYLTLMGSDCIGSLSRCNSNINKTIHRGSVHAYKCTPCVQQDIPKNWPTSEQPC